MAVDRQGAALALMFLMMSGHASAQSNLSDQINSVYAAQQNNEEAARAQAEAQQRAVELEAERQHEADRAVRRTRDRQVAETRAKAKAQRDSEEQYQNQLRTLDLQERGLKLQLDQNRVARDNDYIDQELARSKAETDSIQSQADATRNISTGEKDYLDQESEADKTLSLGEKDFLDQTGEAALKSHSGTISN